MNHRHGPHSSWREVTAEGLVTTTHCLRCPRRGIEQHHSLHHVLVGLAQLCLPCLCLCPGVSECIFETLGMTSCPGANGRNEGFAWFPAQSLAHNLAGVQWEAVARKLDRAESAECRPSAGVLPNGTGRHAPRLGRCFGCRNGRQVGGLSCFIFNLAFPVQPRKRRRGGLTQVQGTTELGCI